MRRVDYRNPRPAGMRQPQKVRPEFGLGEHDQFRLQRLQIRPDREREVHGKVEDVVLRQTLARKRSCPVSVVVETSNAVSRKIPAHLFDQSTDCENFADGNGMDPYDRPEG